MATKQADPTDLAVQLVSNPDGLKRYIGSVVDDVNDRADRTGAEYARLVEMAGEYRASVDAASFLPPLVHELERLEARVRECRKQAEEAIARVKERRCK